MTIDEQDRIFRALTALLRRHRRGLDLRDQYLGSKAAAQKQARHLYGRIAVSIFPRRKKQPTYIAGVIRQKHFVGCYLMPMYSHPRLLAVRHPALKRMVKGKSCINVTSLDREMLAELEALLVRGIALYRKEGWV